MKHLIVLLFKQTVLLLNSELFGVNEFLKYDYIGGPWPNKIEVNPNLILDLKKNPVGNGGFSSTKPQAS